MFSAVCAVCQPYSGWRTTASKHSTGSSGELWDAYRAPGNGSVLRYFLSSRGEACLVKARCAQLDSRQSEGQLTVLPRPKASLEVGDCADRGGRFREVVGDRELEDFSQSRQIECFDEPSSCVQGRDAKKVGAVVVECRNDLRVAPEGSQFMANAVVSFGIEWGSAAQVATRQAKRMDAQQCAACSVVTSYRHRACSFTWQIRVASHGRPAYTDSSRFALISRAAPRRGTGALLSVPHALTQINTGSISMEIHQPSCSWVDVQLIMDHEIR